MESNDNWLVVVLKYVDSNGPLPPMDVKVTSPSQSNPQDGLVMSPMLSSMGAGSPMVRNDVSEVQLNSS